MLPSIAICVLSKGLGLQVKAIFGNKNEENSIAIVNKDIF